MFVLSSKYLPTHYFVLFCGLLIVPNDDLSDANKPAPGPTTTGPVGANKPVSISVSISFSFDSNVSPNTIGSVASTPPIFVVGDYRDNNGFYRNFVSDTISAFEDAGAKLYNECILLTVAGSLPIRIHKQFAQNRKLGKTHQNILIFFKGDPSQIKEEFEFLDVEDKLEAVEWL